MSVFRARTIWTLIILILTGCQAPALPTSEIPTPDTPEPVRLASPTSSPVTATTPALTATASIVAPTAQPSATPTLETSWERPVDGETMIFIPAGEFQMGMDAQQSYELCLPGLEKHCHLSSYLDEQPVHAVYLDAYWIDQTEISNGQYAECVAKGACLPPYSKASLTRGQYYANPKYADFPVIYVTWKQAVTYCAWTDARLPTEAEWEKAAKGPNGYIFPWGNENASGIANVDTRGDTVEVKAFPEGNSQYGLYHMAGNVWEWVADWYQSDYYQVSPAANPAGPETGVYRVLRSSYFGVDVKLWDRTASRYFKAPGYANYDVGFRCAASAKP